MIVNLKNILQIILVWACVLGPNLFFAILGAMGIQYQGIEQSSSFLFYSLTLFILMCVLNFYYYIIYEDLGFIDLFLILIIGLMISHQAIFTIFDIYQGFWLTNMGTFIIFGINGALAASWIVKSNQLILFIKSAEIVAIIIISLLLLSISSFFIDQVSEVNIGGATYQNFGYLASTSFALIAIKQVMPSKLYSYKFFSSIIYQFLVPILLGLCVGMVFLSGARGATLTIVFFAFIFLFSLNSLKKFLSVISILLAQVSLSFYLVFTRFDFSGYLELIYSGSMRITETILYPFSSVILLNSRVDIYSKSLSFIEDNPLFGYGAFSVHKNLIHPHNIFLELALQYGLPIAIIIIMFFLFIFLRDIFFHVTYFKFFIYSLLFMNLIMLTFSGSYLEVGFFWFSISLALFFSMVPNSLNLVMDKK